MFYNKNFYTVESVTSGHPDKICDQISDAILDAYLTGDPKSRVGVECFGTHGLLLIGGEVTSHAHVNVEKIARDMYKSIGYIEELEIITRIKKQSLDIAMGVDTGGAGDQGVMYGYATDETEQFLPRGIVLAHELVRELENLRKNRQITWLGPDGKTQVTMKNGHINTVLVSTQHTSGISHDTLVKELREKLIVPIVGNVEDIHVCINPTGQFIMGGFAADTGLTGRKIMVDTYGSIISHGGGCFSGKDGSKVDRSGAYMARFVAKNLVANGYAKECLVAIAYAIGISEPMMITVKNEKGHNLVDIVEKNFDFTPHAIIKTLGLTKPIFTDTAVYGHFGKKDLPWEQIIDLKK